MTLSTSIRRFGQETWRRRLLGPSKAIPGLLARRPVGYDHRDETAKGRAVKRLSIPHRAAARQKLFPPAPSGLTSLRVHTHTLGRQQNLYKNQHGIPREY